MDWTPGDGRHENDATAFQTTGSQATKVMAEPNWTTDPDWDPDWDEPPRRGWRRPLVVVAGLVGLSVAAVAAVAATTGFARLDSASTTALQAPRDRLPAAASAAPRDLTLASVADPVSRTDGMPSSGTLDISSYWILGPDVAAPPSRFVLARVMDAPNPERDARIAAIIVDSVPVPSPNPLVAGRIPEVEPRAVPLPLGNPLARSRRQLASLTPTDVPDVAPPPAARLVEPPAVAPSTPRGPSAPETAVPGVPMPTPEGGFALYDIAGRMLYMPDGSKLEAHSGYGEAMDDIRQVTLKMRGPTPPNIYSVRMRESLFHGVEALRLTPVGGGKMYGRDGFLIHPFMMGPRGDSNGCVSVKDHDRVLAAFRRGEVRKLVVVASLPNSQKPAPSLLSWLLPKAQTDTPAQ